MVMVLPPPKYLSKSGALTRPETSVVISLFAIVILSILGSLYQVRSPSAYHCIISTSQPIFDIKSIHTHTQGEA